ncbi:MAG: HAD family hydrolase [Sedimentisphaerales bacterium]|nr:HAD family hydrolase [Sedimentisphaerales bacterium]
MPDKKIKAIIFDLGETLLNFGKVKPGEIFRKGARLSYDFLKSSGQPVGNFKSYCLWYLAALYFRRIVSCITRKDFNSLAMLRWAGMKKGVRLDGDQWRNFAWLWYEPLRETATVEPDIKETLTKLKNSGLKLGIVSNTFVSADSLEKNMQQFGILDFFELRMYSYEFDFRKPDPRIFRIAAERIGESSRDILFVGDRIDKDVMPALKIGMQAALKTAYTNNGKNLPDGAWKINLISELPDLIEKINRADGE